MTIDRKESAEICFTTSPGLSRKNENGVGRSRAGRFHSSVRSNFSPRRLALVLSLLTPLPVVASVHRVFELTVPVTAAAGGKVDVHVRMSTDAGEGEFIAFLQAEYSTDGGHAWTSSWAEQDLGTTSDRGFSFTAGAAGTESRVRARVAYRGGVAGAVDCTGAAWRVASRRLSVPTALVSKSSKGIAAARSWLGCAAV